MICIRRIEENVLSLLNVSRHRLTSYLHTLDQMVNTTVQDAINGRRWTDMVNAYITIQMAIAIGLALAHHFKVIIL